MNKYRKAIGAVIFKDDKFLIVKKIRASGRIITPIWDLVKGGVDDKDGDLKNALMRELYEETHSKKYKIIKKFRETLKYDYSRVLREATGYKGQENTIFLVEYTGNGKDLTPDKHEIGDIKFFTRKDTLKILTWNDTKRFFKKNVE